jgi:hypothetical protein
MYTCAHCDDDASASLKQEPLCEEHARERLDTLKSDLAEAEDEYNQTKEEYDSIREELNVKSYGEAEHQLNVKHLGVEPRGFSCIPTGYPSHFTASAH